MAWLTFSPWEGPLASGSEQGFPAPQQGAVEVSLPEVRTGRHQRASRAPGWEMVPVERGEEPRPIGKSTCEKDRTAPKASWTPWVRNRLGRKRWKDKNYKQVMGHKSLKKKDYIYIYIYNTACLKEKGNQSHVTAWYDMDVGRPLLPVWVGQWLLTTEELQAATNPVNEQF